MPHVQKANLHSCRSRSQECFKAAFFLPMSDRIPCWVQFRAEKLLDFCYSCGMLGHTEPNCEEPNKIEWGPREPSKAYGPWMKVSRNEEHLI